MRIGTIEPEDLNSDQIFLFGLGDVARVYIGVEEAHRVDFASLRSSFILLVQFVKGRDQSPPPPLHAHYWWDE
jgi:hypothetical protein